MNKDKSQLENTLINDFFLFQSSHKKCSCKCLFSCFKAQKDKTKSYYISKWRKLLTKESHSKSAMNDPFTILINLWTHKNVVNALEGVRINPNLITNINSNILIRNDLEFYIPQLCSFILFGDIGLYEGTLSFLCKACFSSYYFAHRVIWFLKSMISPDHNNLKFNSKIRNILHIIQTIYKSDKNDHKSEINKLHVSGSEQYFNMLNSNTDMGNLNFNIFKRYDYCTNSEEDLISTSLSSLKQIDNNDINLTSFLSNINFYDHLSNICERIRFIEHEKDKRIELEKELNIINNLFPLNIYIPFSNRGIRNYVIGNFSIKDCKIFKTKERTPILFTAECFRLEEVCFDKDKGVLKMVKNYDLENEGLYMKSDLLLKNQCNKINYLMTLDIAISKPIFIGKKTISNKRENYDNEDKKHLIENMVKEEEYKKIEKIIEERKGFDDRIDNDIIINPTKNELNSSNNYNIISEREITLTDVNIDNNLKIIDNDDANTQSNKQKREKSKRKLSINSESSSGSGDDSDNSPNVYNSSKITSKVEDINISSVFGETFSETEAKLKKHSMYGYLTSFKISKFIMKSGEDLRQEEFSSQLINEFAQIFKIEKVECYLYPYEIISTGFSTGIVEVVPNTISLDQLKQKISVYNHTLRDFYIDYFGYNTPRYKKAIKNLIQSLAGYSLVCYFLQIKDRHNGNILIDNEGHLIHIDFGFILSHAPGNEFETAPFKLTNEIVDIFGGTESKNFQKFRKLLWKGMIAISKHYEKIITLVEMMLCGYGKSLLCFKEGEDTIVQLKKRFKPKENMKKKDYIALVDVLIEKALSSWRTKWYDKYQYYFQGIFY